MRGDRLFSSNSPHDSLTVAIREGEMGVEASASMQFGANCPDKVQKFILAE
jgi:hypothetical protein